MSNLAGWPHYWQRLYVASSCCKPDVFCLCHSKQYKRVLLNQNQPEHCQCCVEPCFLPQAKFYCMLDLLRQHMDRA